MSIICNLFAGPVSTIRQWGANPRQVPSQLVSNSLSLEKAWHGIHFILTGSADAVDSPLAFLLAGGEPIGKTTLDTDPPRTFWPEQVAALDAALALITEAEFTRRFDPPQMMNAEIYPDIWDEEYEELWDEYWMYCDQLKHFIQQANRAGHALVVTLG